MTDNINYIQWNPDSGEVIGTVKSVTIDANDFIKKEKKMNKKMKDVNCVCIVKDGNEVKAVAMKNVNQVFLDGHNVYTDADSALSGSKIVATAKAKCGPNDIFDFNIGAKLALDRLYEGYDMTPKPKRKPYNGIIRVIWNEDSFDAFKVVDGKLYSQVYVLRLPCQQEDTIYEDSSFEEMKQALLNCANFFWCDKRPPMAICRDHVTNRL